jgi:hypothetical protein
MDSVVACCCDIFANLNFIGEGEASQLMKRSIDNAV